MELIIKENHIDACNEAASIIINEVIEKPNMVLGLAAGKTQTRLFKALVDNHLEKGTDYSQVETVMADEYVGLLETDLYRTFRYQIEVELMSHIKFKANFFPKYNTNHPEKQALTYNELYNSKTPDVQLLGLGVNGHIAFNEPNTSFDSETHVARLQFDTKKVNSNMFNDNIDIVPNHAITIGIKNIMSAKKIVLIVCGESKAKALKELIDGEITEAVPASILKSHPNCVIVADKEAASLL